MNESETNNINSFFIYKLEFRRRVPFDLPSFFYKIFLKNAHNFTTKSCSQSIAITSFKSIMNICIYNLKSFLKLVMKEESLLYE